MRTETPPQELEIRNVDYEQLASAMKAGRQNQKQDQFLRSLLRAQRGWDANQALRTGRDLSPAFDALRDPSPNFGAQANEARHV